MRGWYEHQMGEAERLAARVKWAEKQQEVSGELGKKTRNRQRKKWWKAQEPSSSPFPLPQLSNPESPPHSLRTHLQPFRTPQHRCPHPRWEQHLLYPTGTLRVVLWHPEEEQLLRPRWQLDCRRSFSDPEMALTTRIDLMHVNSHNCHLRQQHCHSSSTQEYHSHLQG